MADFGFFVDLNDGFKQFEITNKSQILTKLLSATNPDFKKRIIAIQYLMLISII